MGTSSAYFLGPKARVLRLPASTYMGFVCNQRALFLDERETGSENCRT